MDDPPLLAGLLVTCKDFNPVDEKLEEFSGCFGIRWIDEGLVVQGGGDDPCLVVDEEEGLLGRLVNLGSFCL